MVPFVVHTFNPNELAVSKAMKSLILSKSLKYVFMWILCVKEHFEHWKWLSVKLKIINVWHNLQKKQSNGNKPTTTKNNVLRVCDCLILFAISSSKQIS